MRRALTRLTLAGLLGTVAWAGAACGDESAPVAGELRVSLTTPNAGSDGAILVTVKGPTPPTSASAPSGLRVFHLSPFGGDSTRFAVTGATASATLPSGVIFTFGVPNVGRAETYVARIDEVAAATSHQLRPTLTGYSLRITR